MSNSISAELVRKLRDRTGAGVMECKNALLSTNGNIEAAIEEMRKSGHARADKKASRVAAEGLIMIVKSEDSKKVVIIDINCETDFVSRDENFKEFANAVANRALAAQVKDIESLLVTPLEEGSKATIEEARTELVAKLGENIQIRRLKYVEHDGVIGSYIHGGRIGVTVQLEGGDEALAKDIAMHIAATNPLVVSQEDVSQELIEKEKEIYTAQAEESGKPKEIIEKMINGRIQKYLDEVSLLGQPFVKDDSQTIARLLQSANAKVVSFNRFVVGEGIEKEEGNFAEEVMAQL